MFRKVLVANRGEIASRILRTLRRMGIASVSVHSTADAFAPHARDADETVWIGPAPPSDSYLRADTILQEAVRLGAEAIHPGYGFLSESAEFAEQCEKVGVRFIGPTADQIRRFGRKHEARRIAMQQEVPLLPGTELLESATEALHAAGRIGYPVILKSTSGGGGIGLRVCRNAVEVTAAFEAVQRLARSHFGQSGTYIEKFVERARHVEVQIFGDGLGGLVVLGERDCSTQRRNQKVIEETPAPGLSESTREKLHAAAMRMGRAVNYRSAGTVEFIVETQRHDFFFLEVNTRLQVEHAVTEAVTGIDVVEWMVLEAASCLRLEAPRSHGAAIEARIYAEDPAKEHQPSTGMITEAVFDTRVRVDAWVEAGTEITAHYDPLLAKLVAWGQTRGEALTVLESALEGTRISGLETNLGYVRAVIGSAAFRAGAVSTSLLAELPYASTSIEVIEGGTQTTVQDASGRQGFWAVGVPPSGPMDDLSFRTANRIVGNDEAASGLEMTLGGPTLRFRAQTIIALAGAPMRATADGVPVPYLRRVSMKAGTTLRLGTIDGPGCRTYLAVQGGIDVPEYLGSKSTFMLGRFGGHGGRALRAGDVLPVGTQRASTSASDGVPLDAPALFPDLWEIGVLDGPHGAPDFFTQEDIATLYDATWQVHYNSDRTGVRLIGPKPQWARLDGGEAGLHPSNIHDTAYAVGTVDYTGDMPVILGPDGPSLGGFVCPVTIVRSERWKMGQLKAGDRVRFVTLPENHGTRPISGRRQSPILGELDASQVGEKVVYRRDGNDSILVEYGPLALDLSLRLRAHALMQALEGSRPDGIIELCPGIRSLQIRFDPIRLPTSRLVAFLQDLEHDLPRLDEIEIPTRTIYMPLSWEDPATLLAIEKYMRSVRSDAPWCPSNIEFIRRINGLSSIDDVRRIVFDASYLVLGLGDVYLGAPVATPLDPRHRLVTTKYNPARTWTPENAVGIGGAYLCIYGMEGPGGYQFVGRTLQVWNTHRKTESFEDGLPYLLRFFDVIRFYPVEADELSRLREGFLYGKAHVRIDRNTFRYDTYSAWLASNAESIDSFKKHQQAAFEAERDRWRAAGQDVIASTSAPIDDFQAPLVPQGCSAVASPIAGSVWKIAANVGREIRAGDPVVIVEAMKTEIAITAGTGGTVCEILVHPGATVAAGQFVAFIRDPSSPRDVHPRQ